MGRATRTFTPDQYRAIMVRDGGCRMPGCDAGPEDCEAHHATTHWEDGGLTDLDVGLAFCRGAGHHRLIHEGGWTITGDPNAEVTFHDPDGNARGSTRPRQVHQTDSHASWTRHRPRPQRVELRHGVSPRAA